LFIFDVDIEITVGEFVVADAIRFIEEVCVLTGGAAVTVCHITTAAMSASCAMSFFFIFEGPTDGAGWTRPICIVTAGQAVFNQTTLMMVDTAAAESWMGGIGNEAVLTSRYGGSEGGDISSQGNM
jgi:hypothetical protein